MCLCPGCLIIKCGCRKENWAWLSGKEMLLQSICPAENLSLCQSKAQRNICSNCVHGQVMLTGSWSCLCWPWQALSCACSHPQHSPGQSLGGAPRTLPAPWAVVCGLPSACTGGSGTISGHSSCWDSGMELEVYQSFSAAGQWLLASPHEGQGRGQGSQVNPAARVSGPQPGGVDSLVLAWRMFSAAGISLDRSPWGETQHACCGLYSTRDCGAAMGLSLSCPSWPFAHQG